MKFSKLAAAFQLRKHCVKHMLLAALLSNGVAFAQDFDIKFPADLSNRDGSTVDGADTNASTHNSKPAQPVVNELLTPLDPVAPKIDDPLMQEGSPIPDVLTPAAVEKKNANTAAAKAAVVLSTKELLEAGKKFEANQEFGRALSSYEEAIKIFRQSKNGPVDAAQTEVVQHYTALLRKLNNAQKASNLEKEFGITQP